jgi:hypothetical protein
MDYSIFGLHEKSIDSTSFGRISGWIHGHFGRIDQIK